MTQQLHVEVHPRRTENKCPHKNLYMTAQNRITHSGQRGRKDPRVHQLKTTSCSYKGLFFTHEKE